MGIVLTSNHPETVYQAFRLGIYALGQGDSVEMFLLARGVECEDLDNEQFNITKEIQAFLDAGGKTFSCTSCMRLRAKGESAACPLSTMEDLYRIAYQSDKCITL